MNQSAEDKKLCARMKEIRDLIKEFGLTLVGYDPGISAAVDAKPKLAWDRWSGPIRLNQNEWEWLEPLLQELRMRRKQVSVDAERLISWVTDPKRKPANIAFTEGPERQAAYWMEIAMKQPHQKGRK